MRNRSFATSCLGVVRLTAGNRRWFLGWERDEIRYTINDPANMSLSDALNIVESLK